jgi:tRNA (mo5U34)-methyltransferase
MMPLMKEARLKLGAIELAFAMQADRANAIQRSATYRRFIVPAMSGVTRLTRRTVTQTGTSSPAMAHPAESLSPEARAIAERIEGIDWYHTIELPHDVTTPGFTDHRSQVPHYGLPADLHGKRALDVATYDGFWAFELERRGAEVVAIDIESWSQFDIPRHMLEEYRRSGGEDKQTGRGFRIAHELLGSSVRREILSVYDLPSERLGRFDVVFLSDLLLHLRDPQKALEGVYASLNPGGYAVIADVYNPELERFRDVTLSEFVAFGEYVWWRPSISTLKAMVRVAGFTRVEEISRFTLSATSEEPIDKVVLRCHRQ